MPTAPGLAPDARPAPAPARPPRPAQGRPPRACLLPPAALPLPPPPLCQPPFPPPPPSPSLSLRLPGHLLPALSPAVPGPLRDGGGATEPTLAPSLPPPPSTPKPRPSARGQPLLGARQGQREGEGRRGRILDSEGVTQTQWASQPTEQSRIPSPPQQQRRARSPWDPGLLPHGGGGMSKRLLGSCVSLECLCAFDHMCSGGNDPEYNCGLGLRTDVFFLDV